MAMRIPSRSALPRRVKPGARCIIATLLTSFITHAHAADTPELTLTGDDAYETTEAEATDAAER